MIIDLFSGAGGLSLGFKMAGFNIGLSIEKTKAFFHTYRLNNPDSFCLNEDITLLKCEQIKENYIRDRNVFGVIGGPPCQGFSSVGNRKLDDPRNMLIHFFIKWVEYFNPAFFVMENVTGILSMAKGKVLEKVKQIYTDLGYTCKVNKLLAANYGVPQLRERVFFIGSKDNSLKNIKIPKTNRENISQRTLFEKHDLPGFLTVRDALSDILEIKPFTEEFSDEDTKEYTKPPKTKYQEYLRKKSEKLWNHFAPNHSKLVIERISHISQGKNHADLPERYQLKGGYPNIYGRLHLEKPADTITGNCGCVSAPGRFIHPIQNRAISVREAARLQSFPDHYKFIGNMNEKYKQVGNAVPPLLAYHIAKEIRKKLQIELTSQL